MTLTPTTLMVVAVVMLASVATLTVCWLWRPRDTDRLFTGDERRAVYRRWGPRCAYRWVVRGRCAGALHVDHQHPYSRGGRTDVDNGQPLCERHNTRKSDTPNWRFVLCHAWPVIGHVGYVVRHRRAEGGRS